MRQRFKGFVTLVFCGCLLGLASCAALPMAHAPLSDIQATSFDAPKGDYRIGAGDELEIKFFFTPELTDRVVVRPDGKISLMFAQDVLAEGLTTDELATNIRVLYAPHVKQLDLVVVVRGFGSQKVYVGGEVAKPGSIALSGNETVLQVLTNAGWLTPSGRKDAVVIIRRDKVERKEKVYLVNVEELERGTNLAQNVVVHSGDLILVPPSGVASAGRWVDQNIRQLLPVTLGAGISYDINGN